MLFKYSLSSTIPLSQFYRTYLRPHKNKFSYQIISAAFQSFYWIALMCPQLLNCKGITTPYSEIEDCFLQGLLLPHYWTAKLICWRGQYKIFWQQYRRRLKRKSLKIRYTSRKAMRYRWRFTKCLTRQKKRYYIIMKYRTKSYKAKAFKRIQNRLETGYAYGFSSTITGRSFVQSEVVVNLDFSFNDLNRQVYAQLFNGNEIYGLN